MKLVREVLAKPQFVSPAKVLEAAGLASGMTVIDYASGAGHWSLAAGRKVAPHGKVLAIEDDINKLSLLKSKAESEHLNNIEIEEVPLESSSSKLAKPADFVIVSNILHLIEDKQAFVAKVSMLVKDGGKVLFIDWLPRKSLFGPPLTLRLAEEKVISLFEKMDMRFVCTVNAGTHHYGLIFNNKGGTNE